MQHKSGFFNRPWTKLSLERALQGIAGSGAACCGLMRQQGEHLLSADSTDQDIDGLKEIFQKSELDLTVVLAPLQAELAPEETLDRFERTIRKVARLGARYLLLTGTDRPDLYDRYLAAIKAGVSCAADSGVSIALKPHGGLSATATDCTVALEKVDSESFSIWYDPGNVLYYADKKPEEDVGSIAGHVSGVCVKDVLIENGEKSVMVTPGDGEVNFERVFQILGDAGFAGPCIVETLSGTTPQEVDRQAARAMEFLDGVLGNI